LNRLFLNKFGIPGYSKIKSKDEKSIYVFEKRRRGREISSHISSHSSSLLKKVSFLGVNYGYFQIGMQI